MICNQIMQTTPLQPDTYKLMEQQLNSLIKENRYISETVSNKKKDQNSLSSIVIRQLSQSDCIKLGTGIEKLLVDLILQKSEHSELKDIKPKNEKGSKERDHLFIRENEKIVYYAELKANLNLDTEKSKSTYTKCQFIVDELKSQYPDYTIKWCLLGCRYLHSDNIPGLISKRYTAIQENLFGINQYLQLMNVNLQFTEETYTEFVNNVADAMFSEVVEE